MSRLYFYLVVTILIENALSASLRSHDEYKTEYCEVYGLKIREGEKASIPGKCQTVKCLRASTTRLATLGCSMFVLNPDCPASEMDYNKPYPLCCPHSLC